MNIGLILEGNFVVGKFKYYTAENCFGKRELSEVNISDLYFDLSINHNRDNSQLRFILAESIGQNKYHMIEDFGFGNLKGIHFGFHNGSQLNLISAEFIKKPKLTN